MAASYRKILEHAITERIRHVSHNYGAERQQQELAEGWISSLRSSRAKKLSRSATATTKHSRRSPSTRGNLPNQIVDTERLQKTAYRSKKGAALTGHPRKRLKQHPVHTLPAYDQEASFSAPNLATSSHRAFHITEILEQVLLHLPAAEIYRICSAHAHIQDVALGSKAIRNYLVDAEIEDREEREKVWEKEHGRWSEKGLWEWD